MTVPFLKMHGLGNDFVVVDGRAAARPIGPEMARALADRRRGVGCDQVIVMEPSDKADLFMRIYNPDGSEAESCGNATRCVASLLFEETGRDRAMIETRGGLLPCWRSDNDQITVDMGPARFDWRDIPLSKPVEDTAHLPVALDDLTDPVGVSIGNPHCVFFVPDAEGVAIERLGPLVEADQMFPERTNVEFVQVLAPDRLRMRVWERGAGITLACGSGACAAAVAATRRQLSEPRVAIELDGGTLLLDASDTDHVLMTGPTALAFRGEWPGETEPSP
ncbi:MAG: diaminopimelate epimerase [Pseudomonadota bacterium]